MFHKNYSKKIIHSKTSAMPGTVQVSILELTGLPSSNSSSSMSIKASLGKNSYEAEGEKADFLFPLATLRDNLVVKVHDIEGNEIAHTGVKSRLIAEKGSWDDLFPLEGGGHVHMRLKFSLSEEERNKIRNMRESAFRKKQEELLNKNNRDLQAIVVSSGGRNEMPSTATTSDKFHSFDLPLEASSKVVRSSKSSTTLSNSSAFVQVKEDDQPYKLKEQIPLEKTPSKLQEDAQLYNLKEQISVEKIPIKLKGDDQPYNLKEQSPLENTPIKLKGDDQPYDLKEQNPLEKTSSKLQEDAQLYKLKEQTPLEKTPSKVKEDAQLYNLKEQSPVEKIPSKLQEDDQPYKLKEQSLLEKIPSKAKDDDQRYNLKEQSPLKKTPVKVKDDNERDNLKKQNPLEKTSRKVRETIAAFESSRLTQGLVTTEKAQSGREISDPPHLKEEASHIISPTSTSDEPKDVDKMEFKSKEISNEKEPEGKYPLHNIFESEEREPSKELQRPSNLEQNKISGRDYGLSDRRRRCSCQNVHGWIFLEEAICSCIVSDNRLVIDLLEDYSVNTKTYPGKLVDEEVTSSKDDELSGINKKPESSHCHSSGDGASRGSNGQVMKIVIMVGFGLLVLFGRQKN